MGGSAPPDRSTENGLAHTHPFFAGAGAAASSQLPAAMRIARIIPIRAHMEAATARLAGAASAKEQLKRSIYAAAPSAAPPDL